jgi:CheY-like chemotaxis protein/DNA-directed RNA polymerase specialized sigma24 family protein
MPLGRSIAEHLPFLRRYARALTGSQRTGDGLVRAMLEDALADADKREALKGGRVALYQAFTRHWQKTQQAQEGRQTVGASYREAAAVAHLSAIAPRHREALLLIALEEFTTEQAGRIMGVSATEAAALANAGNRDIARGTATNVLIIEDEPLISMQLEQIVSSMGLTISGTAATRAQATRSAATNSPGLVLADVQLADGSSGLDAVADMLAQSPNLPVIFITAYPERLLTGDRPEPTYLLSKPFHEDAVRAAISQALFFSAPANN